MGPTPAKPEYRRRRPSQWAGMIAALAAMLCAVPATATDAAAAHAATGAAQAAPEGVAVYRCQGPKGGTEFRKGPCPPGTQGEPLVVEDHPVGWTPTPVPRRTTSNQRTETGVDKVQSKGKSSARSARERREETCRQKREQVEEIDRKLRLGANPRKGTELRHRRQVYEDYLDTRCD
jgi:hypothetical protein